MLNIILDFPSDDEDETPSKAKEKLFKRAGLIKKKVWSIGKMFRVYRILK